MDCPCKTCDTRKTYAALFDYHIYGEDCPYVCDDYDLWKANQKESEGVTSEDHQAII